MNIYDVSTFFLISVISFFSLMEIINISIVNEKKRQIQEIERKIRIVENQKKKLEEKRKEKIIRNEEKKKKMQKNDRRKSK